MPASYEDALAAAEQLVAAINDGDTDLDRFVGEGFEFRGNAFPGLPPVVGSLDEIFNAVRAGGQTAFVRIEGMERAPDGRLLIIGVFGRRGDSGGFALRIFWLSDLLDDGLIASIDQYQSEQDPRKGW